MNARRLIVIAVLGSVAALCATPVIGSLLHRDHWKQHTTPLPGETIAALCNKLLLEDSEPLCNGSKPVYAIDFGSAIEKHFRLADPRETPKSQAHITDHDVQSVLGPCKVVCQDVVKQREFSYFRCLYDLRGDGYWINAFYFYYPERTLFSIRSGSRDDD